MKQTSRQKKLIRDVYTVEKNGRPYRILPVRDGYTAEDLTGYYSHSTQDHPEILEDGSRVFYDGEWFIIRLYGELKKETIAILTAI